MITHRRRARLPGRRRADPGDLPVPRGDQRPGPVRRRAAARADAAGKPIVALKAGSSPAGQQAALAHTGSVAGDDAVVDAVLRQLNVIRVTSIEELLTTGGAARLRPRPRGRADGRADRLGRRLRHHRRPGQRAGHRDPAVRRADGRGDRSRTCRRSRARATRSTSPATSWPTRGPSALTAIDHALDAAAGRSRPGLRPVLRPHRARRAAAGRAAARLLEERVGLARRAHRHRADPGHPDRPDLRGHGRLRPRAARHARRAPARRDGAGPAGHRQRAALAESRGRVRAGLRRRPPARRRAAPRGDRPAQPAAPAGSAPGRRRGRADLLAAAGVPLVPGELAALRRRGGRGRAAGLGLAGRAQDLLGADHPQVRHRRRRARPAHRRGGPGRLPAGRRGRRSGARADVDGVLVTPMRAGGVELLAGVTVDPSFGPVLAVGLGGVWVEMLQRHQPARAAGRRRPRSGACSASCAALPLLRGARGTVPADLDALAAVIGAIGEAALSLNGSLRALEVNPLWVHGGPDRGAGRPGRDRAAAPDGRTGTELSMKLGVSAEQQELRDVGPPVPGRPGAAARVRELMDDAGRHRRRRSGSRPARSSACRASPFPRSTAGPASRSPSRRSCWRSSAPPCTAGRTWPAPCWPPTRCWPARTRRAKKDCCPASPPASSSRRWPSPRKTAPGSRRDPARRRAAARRRLAARRAQELRARRAHRRPDPGRPARTGDGLSLFAVAADAAGLTAHAAADAGPDQEAGPAGVRRRSGPADRRAGRRRRRAGPDPGRGRDRAGRRAARRGAARAGHGRRLRQGQAPVRPADRQLPGDQAPLRRPAAGGRVAALGRRLRGGRGGRGLGRGPGASPPLVKAYASDVYFHVAAENIQIHGGIGFTWEHDAHLYFKRAKASELFLGDAQLPPRAAGQRIGL